MHQMLDDVSKILRKTSFSNKHGTKGMPMPYTT
jgi:hypothetical protein